MDISSASTTDYATHASHIYDDIPLPCSTPSTPTEGWRATIALKRDVDMVPSAADIERRFGGLIRSLQREFSSLEHQLSAALQSLMQGIRAPAHRDAPLAAGPGVSPYDGLIRRAAARNEVDPALLSAVVRQESGFNSHAVSPAGAMGLMQLMPGTAKELGVSDPFNPALNVDGGARLLRSLLDRYGGRLDFALAAYNAGPAAVDKFGGVPPYPETQAYVRDVMAGYRRAALAS